MPIVIVLLAAALTIAVASPAPAGPAEVARGTAAFDRGDYAEAMRLLMPEAERGDSVAQVNVGQLYENGLGVPKDLRTARGWYGRAAVRGLPSAQFRLAEVLTDAARAGYWYRRAAEQGDTRAQVALARTLSEGAGGVKRDLVEALTWLEIAATYGSASEREVARSVLNGVMPDLGAAGHERVKKQAAAWRRKREDHFFGSGFVVSAAGHALTAYSNVERCAHLSAGLAGDRTWPARLRASDQTNELALLELLGLSEPIPVAAFGHGRQVRAKDAVLAIGPPFPAPSAVEVSEVSGTVVALASPDGDTRFLQISPPVLPSHSGGAVVDATGTVVGITLETDDLEQRLGLRLPLPVDSSLVLKASVVKDFLETTGIKWVQEPAVERGPAEARAKIRPAALIVECIRIVAADRP